MNRTYLQAIAILMGTAAVTFIATELRWEPANAGNYLVIVEPGSSTPRDELGGATARQQAPAFRNQRAPQLP
ncbi:hypothetical protein [Massilia sp. METH4]|uniref:hypothetical protein n=1 Tax=Massilia sp. METH4 TaxID=3123041 RepID=UPI0030D53DB4